MFIKVELVGKMDCWKLLCAVCALVCVSGFASAYDPLGLNLPTGIVTMSVVGMATDNATMYVDFSDIPEGYDIKNGRYLGWCANPDRPLYYPKSYNTQLYSSYDTNLPPEVSSANWNKINYLVNTYRKGGYATTCNARDDEVQTLIWKYMGYSNKWGAPSMICVALIEMDVEANGANYVPAPGDYVGIVCDNGDNFQLVFIELPYLPVSAPEASVLVLAVAVASPAFGYLLVKRK